MGGEIIWWLHSKTCEELSGFGGLTSICPFWERGMSGESCADLVVPRLAKKRETWGTAIPGDEVESRGEIWFSAWKWPPADPAKVLLDAGQRRQNAVKSVSAKQRPRRPR